MALNFVFKGSDYIKEYSSKTSKKETVLWSSHTCKVQQSLQKKQEFFF